jgi:hypothetical protein
VVDTILFESHGWRLHETGQASLRVARAVESLRKAVGGGSWLSQGGAGRHAERMSPEGRETSREVMWRYLGPDLRGRCSKGTRGYKETRCRQLDTFTKWFGLVLWGAVRSDEVTRR